MQQKKTKLGFSFIEASITIIVISILIALFVQGFYIVARAKIRSAQNLTMDSPVNLISGLRIWTETSLAKSFTANEAQNQTLVGRWNYINPQNNTASFTQSATARPTYVYSGIGGLPTLRFDGINDNLNLVLSPAITSETISVFMVCRRNAFVTGSTTASFHNGVNDSDNIQSFVFARETNSTNLETFRNGALANRIHPGNGVAYILSNEFNGSDNALFLNGAVSGLPASNGSFNINNILIGARWTGTASAFYNGDISELIVFNRRLSARERASVNEYLSKKYGIKLN